jgi:hypothetical protein
MRDIQFFWKSYDKKVADFADFPGNGANVDDTK